MRPLTKRILEAGLVEKHVAQMMEAWGQLDEGASDLVGTQLAVRKRFEDFIEDLEALLDDQVTNGFRETRLDLHVKEVTTIEVSGDNSIHRATALLDHMGRFIVPFDSAPKLKRGEKFVCKGQEHVVLDTDTIWIGSTPVAVQFTV